MNQVRVRYAPSPTGLLHIGNARTAIFNYLFAKHHKGAFIIRIEDTDIKRNVEGGEESQLDNLKWLGITWDESDDVGGPYGPYHQLKRLDIYQKYANDLIELGYAYKEYKNKENKNIFGIRFKVPKNITYQWNDLVRGSISFESSNVEDWIMIKDNGIPTYNFACVVDDHLMKITHILRGEEHITNTPKQIMIYQAFNWDIPRFGHMTLIVNEHGKKLSKRDANVDQYISMYREKGYPSISLLNFIALLGWSSPNNKEILTQPELINYFDEKRLSSAPSYFDRKKLNFLSSKHIKLMSTENLKEFIRPFLVNGGIKIKSEEWFEKLLVVFKDRLEYGSQIVSLYKRFINHPFKLNEQMEQILKQYTPISLLEAFYQRLKDLKSLNSLDIDMIISGLQRDLALSGKNLYVPLRIGVSAEEHGPNLAILIELLGKRKVLNRLQKTITFLRG